MKTVLVDFTHLGDFSGFGEISRNYAPRLSSLQLPDMRFVFLVNEEFVGKYGNSVEYLTTKDFPRWKKMDIDLWHATDQLHHFRGYRKGMKQLLTVHDLNFLYEKHGIHKLKWKFRLYRRVRHSDAIVCISHFVENELMRFMDVKVPTKVIYNGINSSTKMQRPSFVNDGEKFFFTIGQIREKKNFATLVPMMQHLEGYRLFISGDDHFHYTKKLKQIINEEGKGKVILTGKITEEEKNWMLDHCKAFLFPSRFEGFGMPVLEAMRHGTRIVSSRFTSLPEVCSKHAVYWDSYEPQKMAATVQEAIKGWTRDSNEAQEANEYSQGFNFDRYTEEYIDTYRRILQD